MAAPALLPSGQLEGGFVEELLFQPYESRRPPDPRVDFILGQAHIFRAEGNILIGGVLKELMFRILEDHPHPEPDVPDLFWLGPDIPALQQHLAGGGFQQPVQMLHQGGFSPSRWWPMTPTKLPSSTLRDTSAIAVFSNGVPGE